MLDRFGGDKAGPWIVIGGIVTLAVLMLVVWMGLSQVYQSVYHDHAASQHEAARKDRFKERCSEIGSVVELRSCFKNEIETGWETQRAQEDLYAQKEMAQWAFFMVVLTGFIGIPSLGLTGFGVWLIYLNLREAQKITGEAIKQTEAAQASTKASREAADAAKKSVDWMVRVDRPHITTEKLLSFGFSGIADPPNDDSIPVIMSVRISVRNRGGRIGVLHAVHIEHSHELPPIPGPNDDFIVYQWLGKVSVEPKNDYWLDEDVATWHIPARDAQQILHFQKRLYAIGFIRYTDIHGIKWRSGFAFLFDPSGVTKNGQFHQCGPRSCWYDIEEDRDEADYAD